MKIVGNCELFNDQDIIDVTKKQRKLYRSSICRIIYDITFVHG